MKTEGAARILISKARSQQKIKILCTRKFQASIRDSVYAVLVEAIYEGNFQDEFDIQKTSIRHKHTQSEFIFYGLQHIHEIKSMKGIKYCWIEEGQFIDSELLDILSPTLRIKGAQIFIVFNPDFEEDHVYQTFIIHQHPMANVVWTSYKDNPFFRPEIVGDAYYEMEYDKEKDTLLYNHKWLGHCKVESEGALWKKDLIKYCTQDEVDIINESDGGYFDEVVIGVDPAVTDVTRKNKDKVDTTGIIVAGRHKDNYVVLQDYTKVMSPKVWAEKVIEVYHRYKANNVVYESNQGGDMTKTIIHQIDSNIRCIKQRASRGKLLRAEPVLNLYEQEKVKHLKHFTQLEYEMVTYDGDSNKKSPGHLDAMVHALTYLFRGKRAPIKGYVRADMTPLTGDYSKQTGIMYSRTLPVRR